MDSLKQPKPLSFEGNVAENWRRWIQQFKLYLVATARDKKSDAVQCSTLLTVAGEEAIEVYNTFNLTEEETDDIGVLIKKFQDYCIPKKSDTCSTQEAKARQKPLTATSQS